MSRNVNFCSFLVLINILQRVYPQVVKLKWASAILSSGDVSPQLQDLEPLLAQAILRSIDDINCISVFHDTSFSDVFGEYFYSSIQGIPSFIIEIKDSEDLMSPNYDTLRLVKAVRRGSCRVCIIFIQDGERVGRFLKFVDKYRQLDTRTNFIILQDRRLFEQSLHYIWKKIVNVIFIRKFATRPGIAPWYDLTTVPFPSPILEVLTLRRLDTWRGGVFKQNSILFRDKTSDLRRQMLRVVTFQHVPASFKIPGPTVKGDVTLEGEQPIGFGGLEIEVLETLSRIMNFESFVYEVPAGEKWGEETQNGSYSGLIGEVMKGHADIALADLHHTPHNLRFMDLTIPYNTQCLTFLTPEALTDNSWQTLILPFKGYLWTGVLVSLVTGSLTFYGLAKFYEHMEKEKNLRAKTKGQQKKVAFDEDITTKHEGLYQFSNPANSFLYTYSMLLNVSLPKLPTGWSLRVLTGCWWMYSILLVVAYRASMTAILANPVPRVTIDTLEELVESKIKVGGGSEEIKKFFQTSLDSAGKKIGSRFELVKNVDSAVARVANGEFAYYENIYFLQHASVRRQILSMEAARRQINKTRSQKSNRNLHIMSNCVINMPISLGLQKNSPLKPRVDRYLQLITQAGLVQKWLQDAMAQVLRADHSGDKENQKALMDLKKFLGALVALGAGYAISFFIFILEITYWHFTVVRHPNYDPYSNSIYTVKQAPSCKVEEMFHY